jgi:type II secretory pathway pseudopilin PulG
MSLTQRNTGETSTMKNLNLNPSVRRAQAGMTLIELTVVLLVLIGLAGLLIPYVSGFTDRTHDSTGSNNLANLNQNIGRFETENMKAPNNLETLTDAAAGTIYSKLMNTDLFDAVSVNGSGAMGSADVIRSQSLTAAGITNLLLNDNATDNATFHSTTGTPVAHATVSVSVARVCAEDADPMAAAGCTYTDAAAQSHMVEAFGGQAADYDTACYDYLAFGIGDGSELIGRSMSSAPVHFASRGDMGPVNMYNRFVAIYQVDKNNTAPCSTSVDKAKFVGTAMAMMQGHLWGVGHSIGHAYENISSN